jgi:ATP-dependent Lon protease
MERLPSAAARAACRAVRDLAPHSPIICIVGPTGTGKSGLAELAATAGAVKLVKFFLGK